MNTICISGNLTRDAEIRESTNGGKWATFTVAVQDSVKTNGTWEKATYFLDCIWSGGLLPYVAQDMTKGTKVCVCGKLTVRSYTDKDGANRKQYQIKASDVEVMRGNGSAHEQHEQQQTVSIYDEDIPF